MAKCVVIFVGISLLAGIPCTAAIITVDPNGSADYTTIQAAINDANDGDMVLVADGTYTGAGNRDIDFLGKVITVKSDNGPENCIIDCEGSWPNQNRGFLFHNGEGPDSILDGLTITNGLVIYDPGRGGGIYIGSSSPTIQNCVISGNRVSPTYSAMGGGIFLRDSLSLIDNCIISDNWVSANSDETGISEGGGIHLWSGDVTIRNCIIAGNISEEGSGGGIYGGNNAPVITNCTIINNECETWSGLGHAFGGGLFDCDGPITNCIFWDNIAEDGGDQLYASSTPSYSCIQGWTGGGIGNIDADPLFSENYHLQSQAGRWYPGDSYLDPNGTPTDPNDDFLVIVPPAWVIDSNTSSCIDAGDPNSDYSGELWPHGKRINMGAYGGTAEASMSISNVGNIADLNDDDEVETQDLRLLGNDWLQDEVLLKSDLDRNGRIDLPDFSIMAFNWLWAEQ